MVEVMRDSLKLVARQMPRCGVFENVAGFAWKANTNERSALEFCVAELERLGYAVHAEMYCLSTWAKILRKRTSVFVLRTNRER
eukprot:6492807-Amphidinium_carterae.2